MTRHPETLKHRPELRLLLPRHRDFVVNHNPYVAQASPKRIQQLQELVKFNRKLVRAFVAAGVPEVAGTDAPVPGVAPGFALHDELEALVQAGMSPARALESATRLPCEWLGRQNECGTIETGKRADLLLLDADPLVAVGNTRRIAAVILGGRYLSRRCSTDVGQASRHATLGELVTRAPQEHGLSRLGQGVFGQPADPDLAGDGLIF